MSIENVQVLKQFLRPYICLTCAVDVYHSPSTFWEDASLDT